MNGNGNDSAPLRILRDSFELVNPTSESIANVIAYFTIHHSATPARMVLTVPEMMCYLWELRHYDGRSTYIIEFDTSGRPGEGRKQ
jgi:hypothetical protein